MEPQPNTESAPQARPTMDPKVWNMNVEAPVAGLNYATLLNRFIAVVIDLVIVFVIMMIVTGVLLAALIPVLLVTNSNDTASLGWSVGGVIGTLISFAISAGVAAWFESSKYQGTPGKIVMKIKVVDVRGQRLSFQQALKRNIIKNIMTLVSILPIPFIGFLQWIWLGVNAYLIYSDPNKQSLYDKYANTAVVNA